MEAVLWCFGIAFILSLFIVDNNMTKLRSDCIVLKEKYVEQNARFKIQELVIGKDEWRYTKLTITDRYLNGSTMSYDVMDRNGRIHKYIPEDSLNKIC